MQIKYTFLIVTIIAIALLIVFFPKNVGGNLCGPVCPLNGLHYFEQGCLGIKTRTTDVIDAYWDVCYGLPIGEKTCYGVPDNETENFTDRVTDCKNAKVKIPLP